MSHLDNTWQHIWLTPIDASQSLQKSHLDKGKAILKHQGSKEQQSNCQHKKESSELGSASEQLL